MKNSPLSGKNLIKLVALVVIFASTFYNVSAQQKVVGGVDVDIKDYPWQVAVDYGCGGSIIGDSWVLTAAHCVGGGVNFIHAGNSAPYANGGESYSVVNVITHPLYGSGTSYSHDFALVEIEGEFNFSNPNIGKIDLISQADVLAGSEDAGVMATITGWGTLHPEVQWRLLYKWFRHLLYQMMWLVALQQMRMVILVIMDAVLLMAL